MSYRPSDWGFDADQHRNRAYHDPILNPVQENLLTISSLIGDIRVDAELCNWLFKDNGRGKTKNEDGFSEIGDFYHNWGLGFE